MNPAGTRQDDTCYMRVVMGGADGGLPTIADCGRRLARGERGIQVPIVVCDECIGDLTELTELAKDRRAMRKEWDDS